MPMQQEQSCCWVFPVELERPNSNITQSQSATTYERAMLALARKSGRLHQPWPRPEQSTSTLSHASSNGQSSQQAGCKLDWPSLEV